MTAPSPRDLAAAALRVIQLLNEVGEAQWRAGRTPVPREDTTERSKGLTSDPTPNIVADQRRLALRAAVIETEQSLEAAMKTLTAAERHLTDALTKWQG